MSEEAKLLRELAGIARQSELHDLRVGFTPDEAERIAAHIERIERERDEARTILAHTDIGSLPDDWTLKQVAEARIDDLMKLRDQVRDTCARAEKAEAENARLRPNAERYEWLKAHAEDYDGHVTFPDVRYRNGLQDGFEAKTVDAAIDAARKP